MRESRRNFGLFLRPGSPKFNELARDLRSRWLHKETQDMHSYGAVELRRQSSHGIQNCGDDFRDYQLDGIPLEVAATAYGINLGKVPSFHHHSIIYSAHLYGREWLEQTHPDYIVPLEDL